MKNVIFNEDLKSINVITPDSNTRYYIMSYPNDTSEHIIKKGIYEKELIKWALDNYKNNSKIFVDIGAHMGTYSFNLAPHFRETYAFEAQRNTYYQLCGGIALNRLYDKIKAYNVALSSNENLGKELELKIVSLDGGGSSIKSLQNNKTFISIEKVKCDTLDNYNLNDIGLIKIDVEGAEIDVIKGAYETIKRNNYPPIIFEAWDESWFAEDKNKLFEYIKSLGYKIQKIYSNNMFLAHI